MRNIFIFLLFFASCEFSNEKDPADSKAQEIIDKTIEQGGGKNYENVIIDFDFRDFHYRYEREGGIFKFHRIKKDSTVNVHDILSNEGFLRNVNNKAIAVPDSMATKYSASINSVIYFVLLPYGLNDPAVNKEFLGEISIGEKNYYKIKVTFDEEGGGEDHEDVYIYWIDKKDYVIDYLAYRFYVEGGGYRFRKAENARNVNGIRFVDYLNYKPLEDSINLENIDNLYLSDSLEKVSEIKLMNVEVQYP